MLMFSYVSAYFLFEMTMTRDLSFREATPRKQTRRGDMLPRSGPRCTKEAIESKADEHAPTPTAMMNKFLSYASWAMARLVQISRDEEPRDWAIHMASCTSYNLLFPMMVNGTGCSLTNVSDTS